MLAVKREGPVKITKKTIESYWPRRAAGQRIVIQDNECRGLSLIVNAHSMTWTYSWKPPGVNAETGRRFSSTSLALGNTVTHTPDQARNAANLMKGQAKGGADLAKVRRDNGKALADERTWTVNRLLELYEPAVKARVKKSTGAAISAGHAADELAHMRFAVAAMKAGRSKISEIGKDDLRMMLDAEARKPATARARFGACYRFFDWAKDQGYLTLNPCDLIAKARRPGTPSARTHCLSPAQLARIWHAADGAEGLFPVHRDLIRFLIAVPCRRGEARSMDWSQVDLTDAVWRQPSALTKNGKAHQFHLHALALQMLWQRHLDAGAPPAGLVFPAPRTGRVIDTFGPMKVAIDIAAELTGWHFHDFRRSYASALGEASFSETVADLTLNHRAAATRSGVLGAYQVSTRWDDQVKAMQLWGDLLAAAISGKGGPTGSNVLNFRKAS